ncbi:MAG: MotA/TolQ/ExbB proton channel family protein [Bdellovibrio sp. CG10_big_fil_rev_8_21_14_0_10_47_8]|nr:MAG: MotA/TolQ/ExbB proton channel family protein [Bdellovibrio sp. CG10_big_fil_rev_8_21_14_0_10_47_8]
MNSILQFINDAGIVGWCIMLLGVASLAIITERVNVLYFKYGMNVEEFMTKVQTLVLAKKVDEALVLCAQMNGKPLANAFKNILEKSDREDDAIFQAHDIAMAETVPLLTRRLHYLSMLANVATLMGLLGTIHGLILSFQAVAMADPSQKQALLASGISISMYTTALGLAVAIPLMVFYSFLVSRQNVLVEQLTEKCGKLTELLTGSQMTSLSRSHVYPDSMGKDSLASKGKAPPPNHRAS